MELGPRDKLSQAFVHEMHKGRTFAGPYGDYVHLDVRHLGEEKLNTKLPFVRELAHRYVGIDPVHEPIPVRPVVHYMMGGVHTDVSGATPLPGLYAAGEAACVSINGANRLGSNSLTECLVFGARAGRHAAAFASQHPPRDRAALAAQTSDEAQRIAANFIRKDTGSERVASLSGSTFRTGAYGIARLTPADRSSQARRHALPQAYPCLPNGRAAADRLSGRGDYTLAASRTRVWPMTDRPEDTMPDSTITLEIFRYHPEQDEKPKSRRYEIPYREDWVVLDALNYVKDRIDGTLAYRWSCRMGVCGSCGMMINGTPRLSCAAFLREYYPHPVRVEPLANFPVERDLVIVLEDFMHKLREVKPWLIRERERPLSEGEYHQTPDEVAAYKQFSMCINCMLCYAACPVYGLEPRFLGPAAIALAQRYNLDSRDQGRAQRQAVLSSEDGIWDCTLVGECTVACPEHVDPAGAIQRAKLASTMDWYKRVLMPWGER